jgi:hypothetical protein
MTERMVKVVELLSRDSTMAVSKVARFVLNDAGSVDIVGLGANGHAVAERLVEKGIPGPKFSVVKRDQGSVFLELLSEAFRGSRLWATTVFEMPESEALGGS